MLKLLCPRRSLEDMLMNLKCSFSRIFYRWSVPILLIGVSVTQIILAHVAGLSPWKGGGFGMFGAIDSPDMRFLHCDALDTNGNPVLVEVTFSSDSPLPPKLESRLRSMPEKSLLQHIANVMLHSDFIRSDTINRILNEKLKSANSDAVRDLPKIQGEKTVYRMLTKKDPKLGSNWIVRLKKMRLQMWHLRYNAAANRIWCEPLGDPVEMSN